jgi:hypothetical protein
MQMRVPVGVVASDKQSDLRLLAFNEACQSGDLKLATSLLGELDAILLGSPMAWGQRMSSLRLIRSLHSRLAVLRDDAAAAHPANADQPQHDLVA